MEFKIGKKYIDRYGQKWLAIIRRDGRQCLQKLGRFGNKRNEYGEWFKGQGLIEIE